MSQLNSEYSLYRILSGKLLLEYGGESYTLLPPSFDALCEASLLYDKTIKEARLLGALSEEDLVHHMVDHGLWSANEEGLLKSLPEQIDNIKVDMYNSHVKLQETSNKRKALKQVESQLENLLKKKNKYVLLTAEGIADFHKTCFLICCGCGLDYDGSVNLSGLYYSYLNRLVSAADIRNLSQLSMWQQYWSTMKLGNHIFGPILTQEQQLLISWSKFYDNIYESAECPVSSVIEDNDLLDGWCIVQRRNKQQEEKKHTANNFGDAGEIFVQAEDARHAQRINDLNDAQAKIIRKQQEKTIQQRGSIEAQHMPDVQLELRQKSHQMLRDKLKGN